jgi:N-acetylglucosamine repressor
LSYKHIAGWENVPLVKPLEERFGVPVFLENTIRTMALAELWFGRGRGVRNLICLGMRTGIGAGIIIDGQLYHGADNRAGEIGDWPCAVGVPITDPLPAKPCSRLEDIVSFKSLQDRLPQNGTPSPNAFLVPGTGLSAEALLQAAQAGDPDVLAILDRVARTLGLALNQLDCAFNPEKIILAGVLPFFGDPFLQRLQQNLKAFATGPHTPAVVYSTLGTFNGAIGAAALAVHEWKPQTH